MEKHNAVYALAALGVRLGGAATLVWLAKDGNELQREHALLAMWKVVAYNADAASLFARCGAVSVLADRINDGTDAHQHNAWMALAHIAQTTETHDAIRGMIGSGNVRGIPVLVAIARTTGVSASTRAWATNTICDAAQDHAVTVPLVDAILDILKNGTEREMERAARATAHVATSSASIIVERGAVPILTGALLRSRSASVQESAALVLCQIATTCPGHRREIRRSGGIGALACHVLRMTRGTCGAIAALYVLSRRARTRAQIRAAGIVPVLIAIVMRGSSDAAISFVMVLRLATDADGADEIRACGVRELVAHAKRTPDLWACVGPAIGRLCGDPSQSPSVAWTDLSFPESGKTTLCGRQVDLLERQVDLVEIAECDRRAAFGKRRHVTEVLGWTRGPDRRTYIVTEHAAYGSLVDRSVPIDLVRIAMQLCTGMMDLADEGIVHGALTIRNTRVFEIGEIRVKIGAPDGGVQTDGAVAFAMLLDEMVEMFEMSGVDELIRRCREIPQPTFDEIYARLTSIREAPLCVVCMDRRSVYAAIPCGHRCLCEVEAHRFVGNQCPICRCPVLSVVLIYDV